MDDPCFVLANLELAHKWVHRCSRAMTAQELERAHVLGHKLIDLLNEIDEENGVKLLAVMVAMAAGVHHLEAREAQEIEASKTIH